jgi:endonuclease/exonuclease/phosphatase family metal-dependent hydrolase
MGERASRTALVAVVAVFAAEAVRAGGPLLVRVADGGGGAAAVIAALVCFCAPVLAAPLARWLGARRATVVAVVALAVLRLLAQIGHAPSFVLGMALAVAALGALVLACDQAARDSAPGLRVGVGLALGGALDTAVRAAFGTWDPIWRPGPLPWLYAVVACGVLLAVLRWSSGPTVSTRPPRRLAVVGLYLALYVVVLGSPAFLAARSGMSLPWAAAVLLVGWLLAIEAANRLPVPGGSAKLPELSGRLAGGVAALLLVAAVALAAYVGGPLAVPAVLVGQIAATVLVTRAFTPARPEAETPAPVPPVIRPSPRPRPSSATATAHRPDTARTAAPAFPVADYALHGMAAGIGFAALAFGYQATVQPLLLVAGAALVGLAGLGVRVAATVPRRRGLYAALAGVPAVLLLVPVLVVATAPSPATATGTDTLRLVSWNVHQGGTADDAVNPGALADTLRAQRPDVVLLQDVGRGTMLSGGTDLAEYLSRALAMPYVWSPDAGGQRGTVILSSLPISATRTGTSYAGATLTLRSGHVLRVYTAESAGVLGQWHHTTPAVIAGSLGAGPADRFESAGLVSAQDTTGHSGMQSYPSDGPDSRPDWIFGTADVSFSRFAMPASAGSDHRPLATTVHLG